jgi:hypothetical protein
MESDSENDVESYQRGGRVMKGRKRGLRPAKKGKGNVQIVTVNVTRPQAKARGNAPRQVPATIHSFVQQPTMIRQPYSLSSTSGPYQSYREEAEQQRLGEYFKRISSEPDKAQSFNELPRRIPTMAEFSSQTDPIRFSDFSSQTDPNKDINFAEMDKSRKKLKPVEEPVEEPEEKEEKEEKVVREGDKPLSDEDWYPENLFNEPEKPKQYAKAQVDDDRERIVKLPAGQGKSSHSTKDNISAILAKYNIKIDPKAYGKSIDKFKDYAYNELRKIDTID